MPDVYLHGAPLFDFACIVLIHMLIYWLARNGPLNSFVICHLSHIIRQKGMFKCFLFFPLIGLKLHEWVQKRMFLFWAIFYFRMG